jgi:PAS domain S-box-containing protein
LIAATCGVASLYLGSFASVRSLGFIWWTWWLGDLTGVLTVGPLVLVWSRVPRIEWEPRRLAEGALLLVTMLALASAVFGMVLPVATHPYPMAFLACPFLVWGAFRFGLHGAATTIFLLSTVAVIGTAQGTGPFSQPTVQESLLLLQMFMGVISVTALVMAAVLEERHAAESRLRESEEQSRLLTDALPHMVWTMRPDLTIDFLNDSASQFTGKTIAQVNLGGWRKLVHPDDVTNMLTAASGPLERGEPYESEYRLLHHTGEYRWVISMAVPLKDDKGAVVKWIGSTQDIHDRHLAERQFRVAVEGSPVGVFLTDREGKIVLANAPLEEMFGYGKGELLGRRVEHLIPERYRERHPSHRSRYFADPQPRAMGGGRELCGLKKDGNEIPVEVGLKPVPMDNGLHVMASVIDISSRRKAEQALRESEAKFRQLADAMPQIVWASRPDGLVDYFNRRWYELTGAGDRPPADQNWLQVLHPEDRQKCLERWYASVQTGQPYQIEYRFRFSSTEDYRWHLGRALPVRNGEGRIVRWFGTCTDIHDQKLAEERLREMNATLEQRVAERTAALRESEERFRSAFEFASIGMALVSPEGRWLQVSRSLCELVGYSELELLATDFQSITHPDDLDTDMSFRRQILEGTIDTYQIEKRYIHKQNHVVHVLLSVSLVRDASSRPLYFIAQIQDISQRKEAEKRAATNEALLRLFIKHSPAAIAMFDTNMCYIQCSDRWRTDYALPAGEITGLSHYQFFPDIPDRWKEVHQRVLAGAVESCDNDPFHRADGSTIWVQWECRPWRTAAGIVGGLILFGQVVTERKLAEERIRASLREKEVLLKEIHHRVKNNLQIVSTLLDLQSDHTQDQQALEMFKESRGRVRSMALIHERLYRTHDLARVDFNEYVEQLARDLYQTYRVSDDKIVLHVEVAAPPLPVDLAIPCGLLLNELMSNCFKHAFADTAEGWIRVTLRSDGRINILTVADNGAGFPRGLDFRNSTSFGLQLVNMLVKQLKGEVELNTAHGSEIVVTFQAAETGENENFT